MDPATLSTAVRELATEASQVLRDPTTRQFELRSLSRKIADVRHQLPATPSTDLARWLDNLLKMVESRQESERVARQPRLLAPELVAH